MVKSSPKWLRDLSKLKPAQTIPSNFNWTVFSPKQLKKLLSDNCHGITEDVTEKLLVPWGTEKDGSYLRVFQILLSASLVSYTYDSELEVSYTNAGPPDPLCHRKNLIASIGGLFSEAYPTVFRHLEEMNQGVRPSWVNPIFEILNVIDNLGNHKEDAWNSFRDILIALCTRNKKTYWPPKGSDDFLATCARPPLLSYPPGTWARCSSCSHLIQQKMETIKANTWIRADEAQRDGTTLGMGQTVLLDERIWTEDKSAANPPGDFPLIGKAVGKSNDAISVMYPSHLSTQGENIETFDFPASRVYVSCHDVPNPAYTERVRNATAELSHLFQKHADSGTTPQTLVGSIDKADTFVLQATSGNIRVPKKDPTPSEEGTVGLSVKNTCLFSRQTADALKYIRTRTCYMTFPRNSKVAGQANTVLRYVSSPGMSGSTTRASVVGSRGLFTFEPAQCTPRAEHFKRSFVGALSEGGLPRQGYLRLMIYKMLGDTGADVIEVESLPGITMSYSGRFEDNRPGGHGTVLLVQRGGMMISITGKWINSGTEIEGSAQVAIYETERNSYYTGPLANLLPHGNGQLQIFENSGTRKSFTGDFQNGEPASGVLYTAGQYAVSREPLKRYSGNWENFHFQKGSYSTGLSFSQGTWDYETGTLEGEGLWLSSSNSYSLFNGVIRAKGEWKDGSPNGNAKLTYAHARYIGEVSSGLPHGRGTLKTKPLGKEQAATVQTGRWAKGSPQGPFIITKKESDTKTTTTFASGDGSGNFEEMTPKDYHISEMLEVQRGSTNQKRKRAIPHEYLCPITQDVMRDPHVAEDGITYDLWAIKKWMNTKNTSPMTNMPMGPNLIPNRSLKNLIKRA